MCNNLYFHKTSFFEAASAIDDMTATVICGIPLDISNSFKSGCKFAPDIIRICSETVEHFSPVLNKNIDNINFADIGNMELTFDNNSFLTDIENAVDKLLKLNKKLIFIGGEHTITYPILKAYKNKYQDISILHFDAHLDLKNRYQNNIYSHACVMRRVYDDIPYRNILHIGCRSYIEKEYEFAQEKTNLISLETNNYDIIYNFIKNKNVYITIDMDFFDPAEVPEVGTPEILGTNYKTFINFFSQLYNKLENLSCNFIGADVVELSPSGLIHNTSAILTANLIRELLILMNN